jgi:hypothetical protein
MSSERDDDDDLAAARGIGLSALCGLFVYCLLAGCVIRLFT